MTAPTDDVELRFLDPNFYELVVSMDKAGLVEIQHQAGNNDRADRHMARLAAEIDAQLTPEKGRTVLPRAGRGTNVMPCADCGRMLHINQLVWLRSPAHDLGLRRSGNPIPRVGCNDCARTIR